MHNAAAHNAFNKALRAGEVEENEYEDFVTTYEEKHPESTMQGNSSHAQGKAHTPNLDAFIEQSKCKVRGETYTTPAEDNAND